MGFTSSANIVSEVIGNFYCLTGRSFFNSASSDFSFYNLISTSLIIVAILYIEVDGLSVRKVRTIYEQSCLCILVFALVLRHQSREWYGDL